MMPDLPNMPPSPYAALYDLLIPADDELRLIHDLVSFDFVRRARTDLTYKYFLDLAPEDGVINPSSLTKFRRQRMDDDKLL
ncbi:transposase, partial [Exiguobacterium sp. SH5S4]|uniref:transposase n=1 Tax=Exiguobacterium sp. SH5S4 TaxID=2510961 RepID=UPI00103DAE6C